MVFIKLDFVKLQATAPGLKEKVGKLASAYDVAGHIAPYFAERLVAYIHFSALYFLHAVN